MQTSPPLQLFIDPDAQPVARHRVNVVPLHFEKKVKDGLERDVKLGVLERVPPNTPVGWQSALVVTTKKDGTPRRTVDYKALNKHAKRQTHGARSPFVLASSVPANTYKTTLDAWNGYHSVPIKEEDRHYTTFVTQWSRFRYITTPQGFLAAGDGYNHRFDEVTRGFENHNGCVDDTIIWAETIEESFHRTCEYLTLCGNAGIILNKKKLNFGKKKLEYLGFEMTEEGVEPGPVLLQSILDFERPRDISGVRSWFGLVEQVSWAFSKTEVMAPMRHLLSPKTEFLWTQELAADIRVLKKRHRLISHEENTSTIKS